MDYQFIQIDKISFEILAQVSCVEARESIQVEMLRQMKNILFEKQMEYVQFHLRFAKEILPDAKTGKKRLVVNFAWSTECLIRRIFCYTEKMSAEDREEILQMIQEVGIDALSRDGAMLHIFAAATDAANVSELGRILSENMGQYTEFIHSKSAIADFTLVLQNAFVGILIAFVLVLIFVIIFGLRSSIDSGIEADFVNMGILKAVGITSKKLRQIQLLQYLFGILGGMLLDSILAIAINSLASRAPPNHHRIFSSEQIENTVRTYTDIADSYPMSAT